ncbi:MAG: DUF2723 domain-containing protein [Ignavibacteria bacterium]|nr:DUF2723 domain-containing protein [Ignavibacteria bacterium]
MKSNRLVFYSLLTLSFLFPFLIYFLTTNRSLDFTDNGELMAVCCTLGIPHPTGYPLFTILGYLWSLLPIFHSKIFQMNLLSAFWTASASLVFFLAVVSFLQILGTHNSSKKVSKNIGIVPSAKEIQIYLLSFLSTLSFAFARTIWGEATSLEVYSLQILLFNLIFLTSFKAIQNQFQAKWVFLLAFLLGLGFSNHLTTVLILPSLLFLVFFRKDDNKIYFNIPKIKSLLLLLIPFVVGLSFYLYLPIRSSAFPLFNWGWVSRSFEKFLYHVSGKQYRVWMFSSAETIGENFQKFLSSLPYEFAYVGLIVVFIGFVFLTIRNRYLLYLFLLALLFCLVYSLNYQIHDIQTYFSLAFISLFFVFSAGLFFIWERFKKYAFTGFIVPILLLIMNFNENDESKNNLVVTYTKNIVDNLEPKAIIISAQWDYFCSAFWYLQQVEAYRKDIVLIEKELLRRTWYLEQLKRWYPDVVKKSEKEMELFLEQLELFESEKPYNVQLIQSRFEDLLSSFVEKNIDERPVYITFDILQNEYDRRPFLKYEQIPQGFALRLLGEYKEIPSEIKGIEIEAFEKHLLNDNYLIKGIIQSALNNLVYLESYYRTRNLVEKSERIRKYIEKLSKVR